MLYMGRTTYMMDAFGVKTDKEFVNTLEDIIHKWGAMHMLISNGAKSAVSKKALDPLRALFIKDWHLEPHNQQQNFLERHYRTVKTKVNTILNWMGALAYTWLLCLLYIVYLLNHMAHALLDWHTPLELSMASPRH